MVRQEISTWLLAVDSTAPPGSAVDDVGAVMHPWGMTDKAQLAGTSLADFNAALDAHKGQGGASVPLKAFASRALSLANA